MRERRDREGDERRCIGAGDRGGDEEEESGGWIRARDGCGWTGAVGGCAAGSAFTRLAVSRKYLSAMGCRALTFHHASIERRERTNYSG
jgi:hypothetical protein